VPRDGSSRPSVCTITRHRRRSPDLVRNLGTTRFGWLACHIGLAAGLFRLLVGPPASENGEHRSTFEGRRSFDHADIGDAGGDALDLGSGDFWMRSFAAAEAHFDLDLVAVLQETASGSYPHLQVVLVGPWPQTHLLHLGDVLVLLRIAGALVLLEAKLAEIGNAANGRVGICRDFDQVEARLLCASKRFVNRHHADLLAIVVDNAHFGDTNLTIGTRTARDWWT
jgi:hypothetical protein